MIEASIVICTYRRPRELAGVFQGLGSQTIKPSSFQVVVVDNDVCESARETVAGFSPSFPNLEYVVERSLGLSYARMQGSKAARGDWIIYLDDDCIPEGSWLEVLTSGHEVGAGVLGGPVLPIWPGALPGWLTPDLYPYLSLCNYEGPEEGFELNFPTQYPVGANIAYRKHLLLEMGGFRPELGRRGDVLLSGEEMDLNFRIQKAGYGLWYCPKAVVHHVIPPARLKKAFFRSRYYWDGRTWALLHLHWYGTQRVRRELYLRLTWGMMRNLARLVYFGFVRRNPFYAECLVREQRGYIAQAIQILKKGNERQGPSLEVSKA